MTQNNIEVRSVCSRNELDVDALNLTDGLMDDMIEKAFNSKSDDTIFKSIHIKNEIIIYKTTLPIQRKGYDVANMEMYELYLSVVHINPDCKLIHIKTDCLTFEGVENDIKLGDKWGEIKKCETPQMWRGMVGKSRENDYQLTNEKWNITDDINYKKGGLVIGMAGTGKSTLLRQVQNKIENNEIRYITIAPTHKSKKC